MNDYLLSSDHIDAKKLLQSYKTTPESEWLQRGKEMATSLDKQMTARVPAYVKHLEAYQSINQPVAPIDKDNYLRKYQRSELCWDGVFKGKAWSISATSGSSGVPYYFPRQSEQDKYYAITAEAYLVQNFEIDQKTTLYINAFPMGVWIGGVFTYEAIKQVSDKGYALSIITPGINKPEVIKAVQNLASDFDQIIIGSYAPFLKDILDDGEKQGVNWKNHDIKFVFSAEAFSEEFRDYLQKKTGLKNIYKDTLNHYGTVDLGTMAHETPLTILLRRLALKNKDLYNELFGGATKLPTLAQYDPTMFYFEENEGNLFCSSYSGLPLYRYDLKDRGGLLTRQKIDTIFTKYGISLTDETSIAGIADTVWNLPFVYVFERSDFSVSFFAFQVYPETVRKALLSEALQDKLTGKCTMIVSYDEDGAQQLNIHVEMSSETESTDQLAQEAQNTISDWLLQESSEYRKTSEEVGLDRVKPHVTLWKYEDSTYFKAGGKQKWVVK